jgi:serine/threonine protein kinase
MNILLKGQLVNFNKAGSDPESKLDRCQTYNFRTGGGINHSVGLDEPDCVNRYSCRLRELVKHCLMREPLSRPSSVQLVRRTTEGLAIAHNVARDSPPNIPQQIASRNILFRAAKNPEPPIEWTIDLSEFKLDMQDKELLSPNVPTPDNKKPRILRTLRGAGRPLFNSIFSSVSSLTELSANIMSSSLSTSLGGGLVSGESDGDSDYVYIQ